MTTADLITVIKKYLTKNNIVNVLLVLSILVASGILYTIANPRENKIDWLNNSKWDAFLGAEKNDNGVKITPIGRAINHTDTSKAQEHPPLNANSSHLKLSGDFKLEAEVSELKNNVFFQFYGEVPVVYDEWRQERGSIRVEANRSQVLFKIWDGRGPNSMDQRSFSLDLEDRASIGIESKKGELILSVNNQNLGSMPSHNIFQEGSIWFGADAKLESDGWTLNTLSVIPKGDKEVEVVPAPSYYQSTTADSLQNIAESKNIKTKIGAAVSYLPLLTDYKYRFLALSEFNMITPENTFKPQHMQPQEDLYAFKESDTMVDIAEQNLISVHGHSLVMGKATPEWMQKSKFSDREKIMKNHITTIVDRYKGRIAQWDVVNEPMSEDFIDYKNGGKGLRNHIWSDAMGEKYIDIAYKTARKADPKAKLFINDFGLENGGERWDAFLALIKRLQARNVPIDGVGFEAHVYHQPADTINTKSLRKHIRILADLGLESRISEIDVLGDNPKFQAKQYGDVLRVCLSEPTCTSYGTWGISDLYGSTTLADRYPVVYGDSLLWDLEYNPKPAYTNLQSILKNY